MTRRHRLATAALATAAVAALPAAPGHAAKGMEIAISDEDAIVGGVNGDPHQALQTAQALGATRMRILVQWSRVSDAAQRTPSAQPDFNWAPIDDAIDLAALHGLRTQLTLTGPAPAYATGNRRIGTTKPDARDYARFVSAAATHFAGRVDRYAIWNEPNYPSWLKPQRSSASLYRKLYEAGYEAVKAADPSAQVLIGETVPYDDPGLATAPLKWLRQVSCVDARYRKRRGCKPLQADAYAHHPYEFSRSPRSSFPGKDNAPIQELGRLRAALRKLARAKALSAPNGKPLDIHLTESGYFVSGKRAVPARKRAKWLPQQFEIAARTPGVRSMLQYNLFVPSNSTFTTGLLTAGGEPLPELAALTRWSAQARDRGLVKLNTGPVALPPRAAE